MVQVSFPPETELHYYQEIQEPQREWFWVKPDWMTFRWDFDIRWNNLTEKGKGTPCVFRVGRKDTAKPYEELSVNPIRMTEKIQCFAADLLSFQKFGRAFDDLIKEEQDYIASRFTGLYGNNLAYCNGQGFNNPGDPRANFIKRDDLKCELPKMFALIDGTDSFSGVVDGKYVHLDSWLENDIPTNYDYTILDDPRVAWCTIIRPTVPDLVGGFSVYQFPQLDGIPVPRPFITKEPVSYWLDEMQQYQGERRGLYWPERPFT